ncbi:hypothetical protein BDB00DRAFT_333357 [Zychaea mexicana]|uniref:uncharacterized protein n=1 Tax=Zychaea mexicana TaxID=64656 RepID=UPI0022FED607|nr:uncharacterized protein BDB00DRAFT_333357 [Zychaea mexicana]KAI9499087.1 hypothetical protein BDB00DRAFT_333357 [Zychaea mexicana]
MVKKQKKKKITKRFFAAIFFFALYLFFLFFFQTKKRERKEKACFWAEEIRHWAHFCEIWRLFFSFSFFLSFSLCAFPLK